MDAITASHDGDIPIIDTTLARAHQSALTQQAATATKGGQIADTLPDHLGPRTIVPADKAHDADLIRELIQYQGATPDIWPASNRQVAAAVPDPAALPRARPDRAVLLEAKALAS